MIHFATNFDFEEDKLYLCINKKIIGKYPLFNVNMEYDIFISYSRRDSKIVDDFCKDLEMLGYHVWIDKDGIESGNDFKEKIVCAIENARIVVFFSSVSSNSSEWTAKEIGIANSRKKQIIPVKIDNSKYNRQVEFDLINLNYIDYSDEKTRKEKKVLFLKSVQKQCPIIVVDTTKISFQKSIDSKSEEEDLKEKKYIQKQQTLPFITSRFFIMTIIGLSVLIGLVVIYQYNKTEDQPIVDSTSSIAAELSIPKVENKKTVPDDFILIPSGILKNYKRLDNDANATYHDIKLDSFYISRYELTQSEYCKIVETNPSSYQGDNVPVNNITYIEALSYCNARSKSENFSGFYKIDGNKVTYMENGNGYRLPNKYEWAFAARSGGEKTKYAAGNNLKEIAWYGGNSNGHPHDVGLKQPNGRGIYDMNGNVDEWVWGSELPGYNYILGRGADTYIGFSEDDVYWTDCDRHDYNGMRLVFIPIGMKNNNYSERQ